MKIYFTASVTGKKYYHTHYQAIIDLLKKKGHLVISDHIINTTESQLRIEKKEERIKFQAQLEKWVNECDFVVAETSFPSISVGYEIALALFHNKPVLDLYVTGHAPSLLAHYKDEKLLCEKYTLATLEDLIDDFVNYVKGSNDTRFTFFITSDIASYLEKIAKQGKLPKSVYLRKLIEKEMKKPKRG